jgi:hypothetical protein
MDKNQAELNLLFSESSPPCGGGEPARAETSTGKVCTRSRPRGLYVSKESEDRLLKDCTKIGRPIDSENVAL